MPESKEIKFDLVSHDEELTVVVGDGAAIVHSNLKECLDHTVAGRAAVDGMESLLTACAASGIDVGTPEFRNAVLGAWECISQRYGD